MHECRQRNWTRSPQNHRWSTVTHYTTWDSQRNSEEQTIHRAPSKQAVKCERSWLTMRQETTPSKYHWRDWACTLQDQTTFSSLRKGSHIGMVPQKYQSIQELQGWKRHWDKTTVETSWGKLLNNAMVMSHVSTAKQTKEKNMQTIAEKVSWIRTSTGWGGKQSTINAIASPINIAIRISKAAIVDKDDGSEFKHRATAARNPQLMR